MNPFYRKLFLVYILLGAFLFSAAQDISDSLKKVMHADNDYATKIEAYQEYAEKYCLKNFDETMKITAEGISMAKKNKDDGPIGNFKRNIGLVYYFKGYYDTAAKYYYESITILQSLGLKKSLARTYNELAKLYRKTKDYDRASLNYENALALFTEIKDSSGISMIENEYGNVFENKKNYAEAIRRYTRSLDISDATNDKMGVSYALSNLASIYTTQKKYVTAEGFLREALELRKSLNDSLALGLIFSEVASNYFFQKNFTKAEAYIDTSNQIALQLKYPELRAKNYQILSEIFRESGNYQQAFDYLQKQSALNDSLIDSEKIKQIEELNTKYGTLEKEKVIQQQKFEIDKRNYWITGTIIFLIMISVLAFSYYKRIQLKQKTKYQQDILHQQEIATVAILEAEEKERQRIARELHDGVGQMMSVAKMKLSALENNLGYLDATQQTSYETIIELVDESCKEIRSVSHNMMPNVLLKNSLDGALKYFTNQIHHPVLKIHLYTEGISERIDQNIETVLYRVIQECVNNVIKHANATILDISLIRDADGISATIEDNGKGYDPENSTEGIGLKNIKSRIQYLKGTVEFNSSPQSGTLVSLHIPAIG